MIQSINSNAITSSDTISTSLPTTEIMNANMPQPPPSASQVILSLAIPKINQDFAPTGEPEESNTTNQRQSILANKVTINTKEFNDENDYPGNLLHSYRQSERIRKSKRTNTTSINSFVRKKKKKQL